MTLVIVAVAGLAKLVGKHRPHLSYLLWMLVILKCLTPPLWSSPASVFSWAQEIDLVTTPDHTAVPATVVLSNHEVLESSENSVKPDWNEFKFDETLAANEPNARPIGTSTGLLMLWLSGVVVTSLIYIVGGIRCFAQLRRSQCRTEEALLTALFELKKRLGVRRQVRLIVTSQSLGPAVFGVFKPTLVLPESLVSARSAEGMKPILAHELVHIRRGDTVFGFVQLLTQILWWFHPLIWWANRQMTAERERLCDEETIAGLSLEREAYAQSLLDVLKLRRQLRPLLGVPGVRPLDVTTKRLEHIMNLPERVYQRMPRAYWLVLAIGATILLPGAGLTSSPQKQSSSQRKAAPASTQTRKSSATKNDALSGSGLIHKLPKDATRVHFNMIATGERNGQERPPRKGEISVSSVGREIVNGVPCCWIEFVVGMRRNEPERSKPVISKLLIPEERLISGSDPLDHIIKGWGQGGAQEESHAVGPRIRPQDGPLHALLPGKMKDVKRLKKKSIKTSLGTLECEGLSGSINFKRRGQDVTITFEIYRHEKDPFGVVSYRMQIETKKEGKILQKGELRLTLRDVKQNVQSELPKSAVVSGLSQNQIVQEFLRLAISGKDAEAKKLTAPNSVLRKQLGDFRQLPDYKTLRIATLYLGKHAVMGGTSTFQTDRFQEAVIMIRAERKDDRYLIDDADLEDPDGLKGEIQRFVKDYPPVRIIEYVAGAGSKAKKDRQDDRANIQGTWKVVSSEDSGRKPPPEAIKDLKMIIANANITLKQGDKTLSENDVLIILKRHPPPK